ncbi:MAG: hydroxymethylbilane synthase [Planctomycetota bacterium]|nr:hydroxymethylbilane synthase [Pirellulales bacterium]RLS57350.1 MAG: hydroxymethylbilane synthase [Planctomycetota bacterium]
MRDVDSIRVGTRGSALAKTQTEWVVAHIQQQGIAVEIIEVSTRGDLRGDIPIRQIGSDGVFVRELELALQTGRIDAAVHSLKDLPTILTEGLSLAIIPERATPYDVLVGKTARTLATLPTGSCVGTSSVRREMLLRLERPDLVVKPIRGNVDTRLKNLDAGSCDAIMLAGAGLDRLGLGGRITEILAPPRFWPAVGQGALVIQVRTDDDVTKSKLQFLNHATTHLEIMAERTCLASLAGGCLVPIGALATHAGQELTLGACILEERDGSIRKIEVTLSTSASLAQGLSSEQKATNLGRMVAARLIEEGALEMLASMRAAEGKQALSG